MLRAVIMGVAGAGKTSVGVALAERIGAAYIDGDDLHPKSNVAKMSAGMALSDDDRLPWLRQVGATLHAAQGPTLVGCSALKRRYRDIIREAAGCPVLFLHLGGSRQVIAARMARRAGHFMPVSLVESQFEALEPLGDDEAGFTVDIDQELDRVVAAAAGLIRGMR